MLKEHYDIGYRELDEFVREFKRAKYSNELNMNKLRELATKYNLNRYNEISKVLNLINETNIGEMDYKLMEVVRRTRNRIKVNYYIKYGR